jgi:Flp pilus assembly protein TadG
MVSSRVIAIVRKPLTHFWRDEGGVSAIEFALVSTFLLVPLLLGASELGRRAWVKTQFENAVQAGVDYALVKGCANATTCAFTAAGIQNAVQTASALGTAVTVAPPSGCGGAYYCYGCPASSGVTLSASSVTCGSGGTSGTYAGLTATYTYSALYHSCGNWLPTSICPASSTATVTWTVTAIARVY